VADNKEVETTVLQTAGNANMKDIDPYVGTFRKAWHERALVVTRSTKSKGNIKLAVSSPDLNNLVATAVLNIE
jgi:beta-galactosidase